MRQGHRDGASPLNPSDLRIFALNSDPFRGFQEVAEDAEVDPTIQSSHGGTVARRFEPDAWGPTPRCVLV